MFVEEPDTATLHQGDVFAATPFPRWDLNTYTLSGSHRKEQDLEGGGLDVLAFEDLEPDRVDVKLRKPHPVRLMMCSHSCEIDKPGNRLGLLVAPIVSADKRPEEVENFRVSYKPTADGKMEYIDQFPVELDGELWAVHFSGMMALGSPKVAIPWLIARKEQQFTEDFRQHLKNKLALFFGRPDDD
jgi:hypothetical protein